MVKSPEAISGNVPRWSSIGRALRRLRTLCSFTSTGSRSSQHIGPTSSTTRSWALSCPAGEGSNAPSIRMVGPLRRARPNHVRSVITGDPGIARSLPRGWRSLPLDFIGHAIADPIRSQKSYVCFRAECALVRTPTSALDKMRDSRSISGESDPLDDYRQQRALPFRHTGVGRDLRIYGGALGLSRECSQLGALAVLSGFRADRVCRSQSRI